MTNLSSVRSIAPAKINFALEILGKRSDGFHDIDTVMSTVSLADSLTITRAKPGAGLSYQVEGPGSASLSESEDISCAAARLFAEASKTELDINIHLVKRIPISAGLGGGSSDAAAMLRALNILWNLNWPDDRLSELASQIGSDVPFFIHGGICHCTGRGELIEKLPDLNNFRLLILSPDLDTLVLNKTASMFGSLAPTEFSEGKHAWRVAQRLSRGLPPPTNDLVNTFEKVIERTNQTLNQRYAAYRSVGALKIHLSGSGPSVFMFIHPGADVEFLSQTFENIGGRCFPVETLSRRVSREVEINVGTL